MSPGENPLPAAGVQAQGGLADVGVGVAGFLFCGVRLAVGRLVADFCRVGILNFVMVGRTGVLVAMRSGVGADVFPGKGVLVAGRMGVGVGGHFCPGSSDLTSSVPSTGMVGSSVPPVTDNWGSSITTEDVPTFKAEKTISNNGPEPFLGSWGLTWVAA